jgi:hypothetical protein
VRNTVNVEVSSSSLDGNVNYPKHDIKRFKSFTSSVGLEHPAYNLNL